METLTAFVRVSLYNKGVIGGDDKNTKKGGWRLNSVLTAIYQIRKEKDLILGYTNNRYNVLIKEPDASKTAYYFGIPIYNAKTGNLVDLHFRHNKNDSIYVGSEVNVTVTDKVLLQNQYGSVYLSLFYLQYHFNNLLVDCQSAYLY